MRTTPITNRIQAICVASRRDPEGPQSAGEQSNHQEHERGVVEHVRLLSARAGEIIRRSNTSCTSYIATRMPRSPLGGRQPKGSEDTGLRHHSRLSAGLLAASGREDGRYGLLVVHACLRLAGSRLRPHLTGRRAAVDDSSLPAMRMPRTSPRIGRGATGRCWASTAAATWGARWRRARGRRSPRSPVRRGEQREGLPYSFR